MTDSDLLARVKSDLGLGDSTYHDGTLSGYIAEVQQAMLDSGVPTTIVTADRAAGVISRGVSDLWSYGSGGTDLSPYFYKRLTQLYYGGRLEEDV